MKLRKLTRMEKEAVLIVMLLLLTAAFAMQRLTTIHDNGGLKSVVNDIWNGSKQNQ